jgi:hypothetical protein
MTSIEIAERIVDKYFEVGASMLLVDDIAHALDEQRKDGGDMILRLIARIGALEKALRMIVDNGEDNAWPVIVARTALAPGQDK